MAYLFNKFDADGSGALDAAELTELYNQNGIMVTLDQVKKLYGSNNVEFTLN
jgi:Ca2+-binding EF-hand superfamily protein